MVGLFCPTALTGISSVALRHFFATDIQIWRHLGAAYANQTVSSLAGGC